MPEAKGCDTIVMLVVNQVEIVSRLLRSWGHLLFQATFFKSLKSGQTKVSVIRLFEIMPKLHSSGTEIAERSAVPRTLFKVRRSITLS